MPQLRKTWTGWKTLGAPLVLMGALAALPALLALEDPPDPDLGDAGKKALKEEREARKAAEKRAREAQESREAAERERDELRQKTQTDQEKAVEDARQEGFAAGKAEAEQSANERHKALLADRLADRVALAATKLRKIGDAEKRFVDPTDIHRFLDLDTLTNDDGQPDEKAIEAALGDLASSKPYLVGETAPEHHEPPRGPMPPPPDDTTERVKAHVERMKQQVGIG